MTGGRDIKTYLDDLEFPVSRHEVICHARTRSADEDVVGILQTLPDIEFTSRGELVNRLGLR